MLELILKPFLVSSGLKSEIVFFDSTVPSLSIVLELNKKHSASEVLPVPFPEISPITLLLEQLLPKLIALVITISYPDWDYRLNQIRSKKVLKIFLCKN